MGVPPPPPGCLQTWLNAGFSEQTHACSIANGLPLVSWDFSSCYVPFVLFVLFEYSAFKPGSGCRTAILCVVTQGGCVADYFWMYYTESNRHFFMARQAIQFWRLTHHVTLVLWYHVELLSKPACSYLQESINKLHVQATIFLRQTSSRTEFFPWTQGRHWIQWGHLQSVVFSLHCC